MKAYLPKTRPLSGDYTEKWFGDPNNDAVTVIFEDSQYDDWVGFFPKGMFSFFYAAQLGESPFAFVLAHGQGYGVDIDEREIVYKTDIDCLEMAITVPNRDFTIACDYKNLYAYSASGLIWQGDSGAMDSLRLQKVENNKVYGHLWAMETKPFVLDVDTWQIEVG